MLTVPASFDEGARALTLEAARAGRPAARCACSRSRRRPSTTGCCATATGWPAELAESRLVLVVRCRRRHHRPDAGAVSSPHAVGGPPQLTRIGVGDHLMLGGDNMDLALAHSVEQPPGAAGAAPAGGPRLSQLVQRCRAAKEQLLAAQAPESVTVTLLGGGSRLVGAARSIELRARRGRAPGGRWLPARSSRGRRAAAQAARRPGRVRPALSGRSGHHPHTWPTSCSAMRRPRARRWGLAGGGGVLAASPLPDTLLLNGGVFRADGDLPPAWTELARALARRSAARCCTTPPPDLAVARGAVAFALCARALRAWARASAAARRAATSWCSREGGGHARICVLPRGRRSGTEVALPEPPLRAAPRPGGALSPRSSTSDGAWQAGELVELGADDFIRLPALAAARCPPGGPPARHAARGHGRPADQPDRGRHAGDALRGIDDPAQRWQLAFQVRGAAEAAGADRTEALPTAHPRLAEAIALSTRSLARGRSGSRPRRCASCALVSSDCWGPRGLGLALLRALFDALLARARRRRRSAEHERAWLNLPATACAPGTARRSTTGGWTQLWELYPPGPAVRCRGQ